MSTNNSDQSIANLMHSIGISHFIKLLAANGVDDTDTLACFTTAELKEMGIPRHGDRIKMLLAAREGIAAVPAPSKKDVKSFFEREESLSEYLDAVVQQGLDSVALLGMVSEGDMEPELGISKAGHRKKLWLRMQEHNSSPQNSPQHGAAAQVTSPSNNSSSTPASFTRPVRPTHTRLNLSTISDDDVTQIHNASTGSNVSTNSISMLPSSVSSAPLPSSTQGSAKGWSVSSFMDVPERASTPGYSGGVGRLLSPAEDTAPGDGFGVSSASHLAMRRVSPRHFSRTSTCSTAPKKYSLANRVNSQPVGKSRASGGDLKYSDFNDNTAEPTPASAPPPKKNDDKLKILKVFENGRTKDERGCMLSKHVTIPYTPNIAMETIYKVITRNLGWHNSNCNIYRQGDDTAGGTTVGNLWAFNGKPLTCWEDLVNGQWVVAGSANSEFINMLPSEESTGTAPQKKEVKKSDETKSHKDKAPPQNGGTNMKSWADRLSDPNFFTGTQREKHNSVYPAKKATRGTVFTNKTGMKKRIQEARNPNNAASPRAHSDPASGVKVLVSSPRPPSPARRGPTGKVLSSTTGGIRTQPPLTDRLSASGPTNGHNPASPKPLDTSPILSDSFDDLDGLVPKDLESSNRSRLMGWEKGLLLGRGQFGMVYQGKLKDGTETAVKNVCLGTGSDPAELRQLFMEIRFIQKLDHPHIVKYYGCLYDDAEGQVQIFLQLMTGGSLASLIIKHKGNVPLDLVKKYTRQLLQGLEYLHARKVVHRDVKGANVLIHNGDCALADFGTSKAIDDMLSKTNGCTTMVGTPYWMAPEVITACDDGAYDTKVDVWSVGCTIVEMVTGNPPWSGLHENMWAAIFHIAQSSEPPPLPADLPDEIKCFLNKTFERLPAQRPTCTQLLADPWIKQ